MSILKINDLEKHEEHSLVFPAFCLEVSEHEVVAIHSSTNVRTVLVKLFLGELPVSSGELSINGQELTKSKDAYFDQVGMYLLDDGLYERLSVKDHFSFFQKLYGSELSMDEALRMTQLEPKRNIRLSRLTASEKRRVHFGRLLFQNPALFIFEEPDQNTDLETKRVFLKLVRKLSEKGKGVLVLTGNMESALSVTDKVCRLDETGLHVLDVVFDEETTDAPSKEEFKSEDQIIEEEIIIQPVRFEKIPTKVNDKIVLFDPPEIDYIESNEGQSNIYIKGEMYPSVFTMTELENRLHPYGFFRCHRSYIVNLQKVREVVTWTRNSFTLVLGDAKKSSIPLSKTKMAELKGMLGLK
ncbi:LytTR family transcriptional regulator DNA-binding domain-containing protein [Cytobacillus solani]|uniref:ABC transporter ATP-binding protein n=1 Tax=Cytobacillus solani TaxID=1637975 RepID=A0A0Q3QJL6_9BACI|nr:LytTR family transcriptional regulator DNA-binding domain-containing protein [Cytobacillus solani]KOP71284.1 ABC transporter ATP-binding protein [Bacillus sp. FJAT-21945]KQL17774.1 ABC transporter ATP-binding protein [Cytobacillus solani]USK55583.1 LytTR family transcriptional regulator DNA-binding domain-containing protein [Cytobacillus solani]